MTETFDAVLAEMLETAGDDGAADFLTIHNWRDRLAAAHAAEVAELRDNLACRTSEMIVFGATALACSPLVKEAWILLESRADAATALLRECLQFVPDDLADRVAGMVGRE